MHTRNACQMLTIIPELPDLIIVDAAFAFDLEPNTPSTVSPPTSVCQALTNAAFVLVPYAPSTLNPVL